MKRITYRFLFLSGILAFLVLHYYTVTLTSEKYEQFSTSTLATLLFLAFGFSLVFYFYTTVHSCFDAVRKKRNRLTLWLIFIVCVPIIGSYAYFEKYMLEPQVMTADHDTQQKPFVVQSIVSDAKVGWIRTVAALVDFASFFIAIGFYARNFGTEGVSGTLEVRGFEAILLVFITWLIVYPLIESTLGGTIGKQIFGLRVIMQNGRRVSFSAAFKRHLLDFVDVVLASWMIAIVKGDNLPPRRLGDKWAKTYVVRKGVVDSLGRQLTSGSS